MTANLTFDALKDLAAAGEIDFYEMALKASAAVQARRWTPIQNSREIIRLA